MIRPTKIEYAGIFSALLVIAVVGAVLAVGFIPDNTCKTVQEHRSMTFK